MAPLGTVLSHFSPNLPGRVVARPSLGPSGGPLEGGPGRPGLDPAPLSQPSLAMGQVGTLVLLACPSGQCSGQATDESCG